MPSLDTRRAVLRFAGVTLGFATAGCLSGTSTDDGPTPDESESHTAETTERTETPPVTGQEARNRALAAEERHLEDRLSNASCLDNWGTSATVTDREATVIDSVADGVVVEVTHPYWFTNGASHADLGSTARYRVTADEAERLDGDVVAPC